MSVLAYGVATVIGLAIADAILSTFGSSGLSGQTMFVATIFAMLGFWRGNVHAADRAKGGRE